MYKTRLGQQIANLVKVLGPEKVIQYVYGNHPIIEFRQQKSREKNVIILVSRQKMYWKILGSNKNFNYKI
ncbi:MAG: hypothetical protein HFI74_00685 [Lachnospiraceae bacterium]|nr:hypothetical protein [Lachnospiraceae bacterium]